MSHAWIYRTYNFKLSDGQAVTRSKMRSSQNVKSG
jgi:hypothetical protein